MNQLAQALSQSLPMFEGEQQALIYTTLLREGALGAERLHQKTGLHREAVQRILKKMEKAGTINFIKTGRNKKAAATPLAILQEMMEAQRNNFTDLLKPLLQVEAGIQTPKIKVITGSHAYGLLQMQMIKLQPKEHSIQVISTRPKEWLEAMIEAKKLKHFEELRLGKNIEFLLSCFSELRGQVEYNNREYFSSQPQKLKRQYRYVETESSSPLQIQVWFNAIVISIFEATPSMHILIEDSRVVKAMRSYFNILWSLGNK
jgi:DNA-binding Lrp family transcriptional regulator